MRVEGVDPKSGRKVQYDVDGADQEFIDSLSEINLTDEKIRRIIDNLNISADVKSALYDFSKATVKVGQFIVKIGRKIIDFVCMLFKEFPNATFGMIFGAIAGGLIASIPLLGIVLGPIFTPIAIALGLGKGLIEDLKDRALARRIREAQQEFSAFKPS